MPDATGEKHPDDRYKHYYDRSIDHFSSPTNDRLAKKLDCLYGQIVTLGDTLRYSTKERFIFDWI